MESINKLDVPMCRNRRKEERSFSLCNSLGGFCLCLVLGPVTSLCGPAWPEICSCPTASACLRKAGSTGMQHHTRLVSWVLSHLYVSS